MKPLVRLGVGCAFSCGLSLLRMGTFSSTVCVSWGLGVSFLPSFVLHTLEVPDRSKPEAIPASCLLCSDRFRIVPVPPMTVTNTSDPQLIN